MATFFIDYEQLVRQTYERKKVNNMLPHGLKYLTPAKLKDECVMRCAKGVNKQDEMIIREFCGDLDESKNCQAIIRKCDTDRFRPLVNYLKGKSESTDEKNIELLAWLIEFPGRPWEVGKKYPDITNEEPARPEKEALTAINPAVGLLSKEPDTPAGIPVIPENPITPAQLDDPNEKEKPAAETTEAGNQIKKGKSAKRLAATVMLLLAMTTGVILLRNKPDYKGGCMYWSEDHYISIACDEKMPNARIIALDTVRLKNFRKITTPDTITYGALGKVWYSKIDGNIEFYTWGGEHPVAFNRRLKPITIYIIDKYILSGMTAK